MCYCFLFRLFHSDSCVVHLQRIASSSLSVYKLFSTTKKPLVMRSVLLDHKKMFSH